MARSARRPRRSLGHEALDDAVLQRMEGDDHQAAARGEHPLGRRQRLGQLVELAIDEDAERLKGSRRRMDFTGPAPADRAGNDVGKLDRPGDRPLRPRPGDGGRHRPRFPFLAEHRDHPGEVAAAPSG